MLRSSAAPPWLLSLEEHGLAWPLRSGRGSRARRGSAASTSGGGCRPGQVVVPLVRQGFLDWLANDERAASEAEEEASRLAGELPHVADARKGEADVMLAIQDALATFEADEIVVALHPKEEASFAERVATADLRPSVDGVPVRAIVVRDLA